MAKRKRRQLTVLLIFGMVFLTFIFALHGSLLSRVIQHFKLSSSLTGMPSAAASAGGFAALLSLLILNGRFGKLSLLKFGIGLCAVCLLSLAFISQFWLFVTAWAVIGVGLGYLDTLLSACMADMYRGNTARRMMCILHLTYGMAFVSAPVVYALLLNCFERNGIVWNGLYPVVSGAGFLLLVLLLAVARRTGGVDAQDSGKEEKIWGCKKTPLKEKWGCKKTPLKEKSLRS